MTKHKHTQWQYTFAHIVLYLVAQTCMTLCNLMDYRPPSSSVHGDSPDKNTEVGCHALLQGIFPTQGSNPGFPHCRWILYHLSHQRVAQEYWNRQPIPFPGDLPNPRIEPGSHALQTLLAELPGKPNISLTPVQALVHPMNIYYSKYYRKYHSLKVSKHFLLKIVFSQSKWESEHIILKKHFLRKKNTVIEWEWGK